MLYFKRSEHDTKFNGVWYTTSVTRYPADPEHAVPSDYVELESCDPSPSNEDWDAIERQVNEELCL